MVFRLPKLYAITDTQLSGLSHAEQVARLADGGAQLIQLRDKISDPREFYRAAAEALSFARQRNVKIIINDRVDLALALGADGVHLGQDDMPPSAARRILGDQSLIGLSTHNLQQAISATREPVDYIAIGPVYSTTSKTNPDPQIGLEGIKELRSRIESHQLVAIGGITRAKAPEVLHSGADSVAMIADLLAIPDEITQRVRTLLTTVSAGS